jgi:drug/metabolite transporter (DMT)-like permease
MGDSNGLLVLGIVLAACGGATLALAMATQRYALDVSVNRGKTTVPLFGFFMPRNLVWFGGLVLYGGANGFYAVALLYGPLSLLAGIFTTLLIFNLFFARCLLGEVLTPPKIGGAVVILVGVVLCILATPQGESTETAFTPTDIQALLVRPTGILYVLVLLASIFGSIGTIIWFEKKYPLASDSTPESPDNNSDTTGESGDAPMSAHQLRASMGDQDVETAASSEGKDGNMHASVGGGPPPPWLDRLMGLVYPASLGTVASVSCKLRYSG